MQFSAKFQKLIGASLILNILHGVEVSQTQFFVSNPDFYPYTKYFDTIPEAVYYVQHAGLYAVLFCALCFVLGGRWVYIPLVFIGLLNLSELHLAVKAFVALQYVSGAITSLLFLPLVYVYWREFFIYTKKKINQQI